MSDSTGWIEEREAIRARWDESFLPRDLTKALAVIEGWKNTEQAVIDLRRLLERDEENEREIERLRDLLRHDHFPSCSALMNVVDCDCGWNDGDKYPTDRITRAANSRP